jgi:lipid II:glycine glycyltransferase (peptidoglycan interpeptide bridge formation enzyme)
MTYQSDEFQSKRAKLEAELDKVQAQLNTDPHNTNTEMSAPNLAERAQLEALQSEIEIELNSLNNNY